MNIRRFKLFRHPMISYMSQVRRASSTKLPKFYFKYGSVPLIMHGAHGGIVSVLYCTARSQSTHVALLVQTPRELATAHAPCTAPS